MADDDLDDLLDEALEDFDQKEEQGREEREAAQQRNLQLQQEQLRRRTGGAATAAADGLANMLAGANPANMSEQDKKLMENIQVLMQSLSTAQSDGPEDEAKLDRMHQAIKGCISTLQTDSQASEEERNKLGKLSRMLDTVENVNSDSSAAASATSSGAPGKSQEEVQREMEEMMKELMADIHQQGQQAQAGAMPSMPGMTTEGVDGEGASPPQLSAEQQQQLMALLMGTAGGGPQPPAPTAAPATCHSANNDNGPADHAREVELMTAMLAGSDAILKPFRIMAERYPAWFEAHSASTPSDEMERFRKQFEAMREVTSVFGHQSMAEVAQAANGAEGDAKDEAGRRMERFLALVEMLQHLGSPPKELVDCVTESQQ